MEFCFKINLFCLLIHLQLVGFYNHWTINNKFIRLSPQTLPDLELIYTEFSSNLSQLSSRNTSKHSILINSGPLSHTHRNTAPANQTICPISLQSIAIMRSIYDNFRHSVAGGGRKQQTSKFKPNPQTKNSLLISTPDWCDRLPLLQSINRKRQQKHNSEQLLIVDEKKKKAHN